MDPHVLLSRKSLALSLSAPRVPPVGSYERKALVGTCHPHLKLSDSGTAATRAVGAWISLESQNHFRDSGGFRRLADRLVMMSSPLLALSHPLAVATFLRLKPEKLVYGRHERQYVDIYRPSTEPTRCILFMHGGAWGSGEPWMYRLVADCFLKRGYMVAIPSYRTYPDGNIQEQVADCQAVLDTLEKTIPITLMGHSSGAHVALLTLVELNRPTRIDSFVGLSGPYNVSHHFDYEANRGVEEISPLKPCNGYTRKAFNANSPCHRLVQTEHSTPCNLPRTMMVHGIEDSTVPFTATSEASKSLTASGIDCQEVYLAKTGHEDVVMQIMLGGPAQEAVLKWIERDSEQLPTIMMVKSKI